MKKLRFNFKDKTYKECELTGFSTLPANFKQSLSLNETKNGKFWLTISESLIPDLTEVINIDIMRK